MFINDVGQNTWEEINDGLRRRELRLARDRGADDRPAVRVAALRVQRTPSGGCAITGGAFYSPLNAQFPADYDGDYFFADFCGGWIRRLDPNAGNTVTNFASGITSPGRPEGDRRRPPVLSRARVRRDDRRRVSRRLRRGRARHHDAAGEPDRRGRGAGHLQRERVRRGAAALPVAAQRRQHRRRDRAGLHASPRSPRPTTARASAWSSPTPSAPRPAPSAVLTVTANQAPTATIAQPAAGTLYAGGTVITYSGTGLRSRSRDRCPPAPSPGRSTSTTTRTSTRSSPPTTGATGGSFTIPTTGETAANVWYRIYLTVRDSAGLTHTTQRDILPRTVQHHARDEPRWRSSSRLDGQPVTAPTTFDRRRRHRPHHRRADAADVGRHHVRVRVVVRRRRRVPQHLDAGRQHDLHRDLSRRDGRDGHRPRGDVLQQRRLHRHDRGPHRSDRQLRLGDGLAGARHRRRHVQRALDRPGAAAVLRDLHVLSRRATTASGCG